MRCGISRHQQRKLEAAFDRMDREAALKAEGGQCAYCRRPLTIKTVTRDHVIARSRGGSNHRSNIKAACARCNRVKGSMDASLFIRMIQRPRKGEPMLFRMIWVDYRLNSALNRLERNLMRRMGREV